ncbi:diphthine synthase [Candidatus Pacearchaeota archaeon RBG_19FT_COMBO_34_9]|nr:MAG: diphthine synthase [Candidatus Pacearchaeota archaeon RBG_19FT_COMBO_34_9]OGJ16755.1 MAG: diphthine synthase [Candidatus Pacearchaeota archaeon RBG_13_33_26]
MLYLIGLGLNEKAISLEGTEAIKRCKRIYLENYTVNFPYSVKELEKVIGKQMINADREFAESDALVQEAKKEDIALLVYGSPLTATTHITLIQEAKKQKVKYEIIYNASVFDAVAETGLQLYKFGKITSIPNFEADSFSEVIKENKKINTHSLILVDIGLKFEDAIKRIEKIAKEKIVVCSKLGTKEKKIFYGSLDELKNKEIEAPFCFIIPSKLHFMESEVLENFKN